LPINTRLADRAKNIQERGVRFSHHNKRKRRLPGARSGQKQAFLGGGRGFDTRAQAGLPGGQKKIFLKEESIGLEFMAQCCHMGGGTQGPRGK